MSESTSSVAGENGRDPSGAETERENPSGGLKAFTASLRKSSRDMDRPEILCTPCAGTDRERSATVTAKGNIVPEKSHISPQMAPEMHPAGVPAKSVTVD